MLTKNQKKRGRPKHKLDPRQPKLNDKQKAFVDYYLMYGSVTEAAKHAGYSTANACASGNAILHNPLVKEHLDTRLKEIESERIASAREVQEYLTAVMRGEVDEDIVLNVGTGKGFTEPQKVRAQVTAKDRTKAAELLGKVRGLFVNKSEVEVSGNIPVVIKDDM